MTSTDVAPTQNQGLTQMNKNYFQQYGESVVTTNITGQLLKFSKGDWLAGQDNDEIPEGTQLTACMDELLVGWIKWVDNKPEQTSMGLLVKGYVAPKRAELGDLDQNGWEVGQDGQARDPWQFTNYLLMKPAGKKVTDPNHLFTFTCSSRGGLNAVGALCKAYGEQMRSRPDEYPVVELGVDSYNHPNKEFGRIKIPVLKIVGWEPKSHFAHEQSVPEEAPAKGKKK